MSKPREFYVENFAIRSALALGPHHIAFTTLVTADSIRVIEFSAYQALKAENEKLIYLARNPTAFPSAMDYAQHLEAKLAEAEEANKNCISLNLHESRIQALEAENHELNKRGLEWLDKCNEARGERDRLAKQNQIYETALEWIRDRCETQYVKVNTSVGLKARQAIADAKTSKVEREGL